MRKFMSDALVIFEIESLKARAWWPFYLLSVVMFPIGTLYFAKWLIPPGAADLVGTRLMTGSLVFALGLMTVNNLAQVMLWERFNFTLKLVITSPVHPLSYALGIVAFSLVQGMITAAVVLSFAPVVNIDIHLDWWLIPVLLLTSLSLTGLGVVIATWSPSQEMGNVLANTVGIMVTIVSPVYFPYRADAPVASLGRPLLALHARRRSGRSHPLRPRRFRYGDVLPRRDHGRGDGRRHDRPALARTLSGTVRRRSPRTIRLVSSGRTRIP